MKLLLMYSTHVASAAHVARLKSVRTDVRVAVARDESEAIEEARDAEVILGHRYLYQVLPVASRLKWVQSSAGGADRLPLADLFERGVRLSRMTIASPTIARHAVTLAWALARGLPDYMARQAEGRWSPAFDYPPTPRRAVVFGTGHIGQQIAGLLRNDGIEVTGVRRRLDETVSGFDRLVSLEAAIESIGSFDWVFLTLTRDPALTLMFDERVLRTMSHRGIIINVGRGDHIDTASLCRVLNEGHLGGAGLDVMDPKPACPDDAIWRTPRLIVTPHVAAHARERAASIEAFCEEQVARYLAGRDPLELVDPAVYAAGFPEFVLR